MANFFNSCFSSSFERFSSPFASPKRMALSKVLLMCFFHENSQNYGGKAQCKTRGCSHPRYSHIRKSYLEKPSLPAIVFGNILVKLFLGYGTISIRVCFFYPVV